MCVWVEQTEGIEKGGKMGEYECIYCNQKFHLDEPPWDGLEICDECREDVSPSQQSLTGR